MEERNGVAAMAAVKPLEGIVGRRRLATMLSGEARIKILNAPVGFGKSALLSEWTSAEIRAGGEVLCVEALKPSAIKDGDGSHSFVSPSLESWLARDGAQRRTVVLDNCERVTESKMLEELLLIARAYENLDLIVASRCDPGISPPGTSVVITEEDLCFTPAETAHLLRSIDPTLNDRDIALAPRVEGLAARGWGTRKGARARGSAEPCGVGHECHQPCVQKTRSRNRSLRSRPRRINVCCRGPACVTRGGTRRTARHSGDCSVA